ncbi:gas vesicle protein [Oceanobacillus sp. 143]|uniref:Gas vesicle protein n=1 Tax=Oceanobacillus zhaokaii TaxID=2052660 RepID=A0A345PCS8_9BACI|nr:gas vesicle protein [Oceanobacillus zhaokaii]AXI07808.1 gas vesicle protein [Oceanobacillus zhaokaii]QGS67925.1 gas vesicle protein [Oceanobacillus sp. 143]
MEFENKEVGLIDILDVVLDKGVAIKGDLILSIAGIDLVYLDLRVLISSVETLIESNKQTAEKLSSKQFDYEKEELDRAINQS